MRRLELDRPRELDELVVTTVRLWVRHFAVFFTLALVVVAPIGVLVDGVWGGALSDPDAQPSTAATLASVVLNGLVASAVITAVHVVAVQGLGRGENPSVGRSLRGAASARPSSSRAAGGARSVSCSCSGSSPRPPRLR